MPAGQQICIVYAHALSSSLPHRPATGPARPPARPPTVLHCVRSCVHTSYHWPAVRLPTRPPRPPARPQFCIVAAHAHAITGPHARPQFCIVDSRAYCEERVQGGDLSAARLLTKKGAPLLQHGPGAARSGREGGVLCCCAVRCCCIVVCCAVLR